MQAQWFFDTSSARAHFKAHRRGAFLSFESFVLSMTRRGERRWLHLSFSAGCLITFSYVREYRTVVDIPMTARYIPQRRLSENIHHRVCLECAGSRRHKAPSDIIEFLRCYRRKTEMSKMLLRGDRMRNLFIRSDERIAKYRRVLLSASKTKVAWLPNQRVGILPCGI